MFTLGAMLSQCKGAPCVLCPITAEACSAEAFFLAVVLTVIRRAAQHVYPSPDPGDA